MGTHNIGGIALYVYMCVCLIMYWQVMAPTLPNKSAKTNHFPMKRKKESPPINLQMTAVGRVLASLHLFSAEPNETDMPRFIFKMVSSPVFVGSDQPFVVPCQSDLPAHYVMR